MKVALYIFSPRSGISHKITEVGNCSSVPSISLLRGPWWGGVASGKKFTYLDSPEKCNLQDMCILKEIYYKELAHLIRGLAGPKICYQQAGDSGKPRV